MGILKSKPGGGSEGWGGVDWGEASPVGRGLYFANCLIQGILIHDAKPNPSCSFRAGCVDATALEGQGALKNDLTNNMNNKDDENNNVGQLTFHGHLVCVRYCGFNLHYLT